MDFVSSKNIIVGIGSERSTRYLLDLHFYFATAENSIMCARFLLYLHQRYGQLRFGDLVTQRIG